MKSVQKNFLNTFFILAFLLAGISPACAFISGKSGYIDVCAADGTLKRIKISRDDDSYILYQAINGADEQKQDVPSSDHLQKQQCGFCFANSHLAKSIVITTSLKHHHSKIRHALSYEKRMHDGITPNYFQSRAPPFFL